MVKYTLIKSKIPMKISIASRIGSLLFKKNKSLNAKPKQKIATQKLN